VTRTPYRYPALLEPNEKGRLVVHFPDLPEALTDGADAVEAFAEAPDCLSTALAARVVDNEDIPAPSPVRPRSIPGGAGCDDRVEGPAVRALCARKMTVADLARRLGIDERKAARLIDPRAAAKLTSLEAALSALGYAVAIELYEKSAA
jgi:antitoxin HicB